MARFKSVQWFAFVLAVSAANSVVLGVCYVTRTDDASNIGCKAPPLLVVCTPLNYCTGPGDRCGDVNKAKIVDTGVNYADPGQSGYESYRASNDICYQQGICDCLLSPSEVYQCFINAQSLTDYPGYTWPDFEADPTSTSCKGSGG